MNSGCIESSIESIIDTIINSAVESVDTIPKTITEWEKKRAVDTPKYFYSVKSDSNKNISYKVTYSPSSNMYHRECKAWECCWYNINQEQNQRTCKHIIAIRGENEEQKQITQNKGKWLYISAKIKPKKKVLVLDL